jgi:hypothetical protein
LQIVETSGAITWPNVLDRTRMLFVEDERHVRIVADDVPLPERALSLPSDEWIAGIAVDPGFAWSRHVYVARVSERSERRTLFVTRYRELQNIFGEPATIVSQALDGFGEPRVAIDGQGRLYLALPGDGSREGALWRLTSDGGTPWEVGQRGPWFAPGFARPAAIALDDVARRLWLTGTHADQSHDMISFDWNKPVSPPSGSPLIAPVVDIALTSLAVAGSGQRRALFGADDSGQLHRWPLLGNHEETHLAFGLTAISVSGDASTLLIVTVGARGTYALWRLDP